MGKFRFLIVCNLDIKLQILNFPLPDKVFDSALCLNCQEPMTGSYCTDCGQKKQARLSARYLKDEVWQLLRWFEIDVVKQVFQSVAKPGYCAIGFVSGSRKKFHHPLKLLLYCLGFYLLILDQSGFFQFNSGTQANQVASVVKKYAKWSFNLGVVAIVLATYISFYKKGYFNFIEQLALALYIHCAIIIINGINLSLSAVFKGTELAEFLRQYSRYYMDAFEVSILVAACWQFFQMPLRKSFIRYILVSILYLLIKWCIIYAYVWMLLQAVKHNILT